MAVALHALPSPHSGQVVHAVPGRVRLRFRRCDFERARALAESLSSDPAVRELTWRPQTGSLVVVFDRRTEFADLAAAPRPGRAAVRWLPGSEPAGINWKRVAFNTLLSLLPLGPLASAAVSFATTLAEETRGTSVRFA